MDNNQLLKLKILNTIRLYGSISKQNIANVLFVNLTTISYLVNELEVKHKLIVGTGKDVSMGGRRSKLYSINKEIGTILGVDIGADNFRVILTDIFGNIITSFTSKTDLTMDGNKLVNKISEIINRFRENLTIPELKIIGIGLGISGAVDTNSGKIISCLKISALNDFYLKDFLEEKMKLPVYVDESVRCMTLAEKHYGVAKDYDNFIFISLGNGIGIGVYANGKIYRSSTGVSGEMGHITVSENGPLCNCGNRGCLEAIASGSKILKRAKEGIENDIVTSITSAIDNDLDKLTVEIIAREAEKGDKYAYSLINRTGEYIGLAIAAVLNLFGPELIVLGGGVANSGDILINAIKRTVQIRALGVITRQVTILKSQIGDNIAALGAATKFINFLFTETGSKILDRKDVK